MQLKAVLEKYDFPPEAIEAILDGGITELYPPQADCVKKGLLENKNILLSVPTAAGKTLMAELCMVHSVLNDKGRCLYIAPLKALASEKYQDFKEKYSKLGIQIGITVGDNDSRDKDIKHCDILIATAEKVDSLLRSRAKWLIDCLTVVVIDEIHFINDGSRGPTLEILTARIRQLNPNVQLVGLSATISNANEMAKWLHANLVYSTWRPIPLKEGVYFNQQIQFRDHGTRMILEDGPDDLNKLVLDTLRGGGQILIFVNSRRSAQAVAREVSRSASRVLKPEEKEILKTVSQKILGTRTDSTQLCHKLAETILHGSAFHHAGLKPHQRDLVEQYFKQNVIKVIGCTPTLAAGVNLPARRAIIRDIKRFEEKLGAAYIPISEYKQCAGRAGRPQYDEYGEAVIMAKSPAEANVLMERYVLGEPEPIISKLHDESALRIHILASIAGGYVFDIEGMFEFISHTFLYYQRQSPALLNQIKEIFAFLTEENFIQQSGDRYFATPFGALTSRLYIDPLSSITLRGALRSLAPKSVITPVGMLHVLTCCPDGPAVTSVGKKLAADLKFFESEFRDQLILNPSNCADMEDYFYYLSTLKTTWLLLHWIEEEKEDMMCDFFNVGPGDIYRQVETAQRLMYAASSIAHLNRQSDFTHQLENLKNRLRYGIKEELLDLAQFKGVGRIRARILFEHGFTKLSDFKNISEDRLGAIRGIGKTLAREIVTQIT